MPLEYFQECEFSLFLVRYPRRNNEIQLGVSTFNLYHRYQSAKVKYQYANLASLPLHSGLLDGHEKHQYLSFARDITGSRNRIRVKYLEEKNQRETLIYCGKEISISEIAIRQIPPSKSVNYRVKER
jgi:hypothetical protein